MYSSKCGMFDKIRTESNTKRDGSEEGKKKMAEQPNIEQHSENKFQKLVEYGLKNGGIHVCASKNHGKTRLLFSMAKELQNAKARVLIFDGSETWLYAYDRIPVFTVQERDIVLVEDVKTTEEIERYQIKNWNLVKFALENYGDILFRLKTRKPSKRGYFVRTVINYLDQQQRTERESSPDHEARRYFAYFIEEAQDCFNSRSTTRLEAEEFLTVFNEARNMKEAFYTASQRLTDFSKTIRTKQIYCIGKLNAEDTNPVRRLEKQHKIDFSKMEPRLWFVEGETFTSPEWKQDGKPFQINKETKKRFVDALPEQKKQSKLGRLWNLAACVYHLALDPVKGGHGIPTKEEEQQETEDDDTDEEDFMIEETTEEDEEP
jgi:hypothetical protein